MPLKKVMAGLGAALLFATGVAAALADSPPPTTDTTSTTSTATTTASSTSTSTSTETTTTTAPATTTSTETTTGSATPTVPTTPKTTPAVPPGKPTPARGLERGASVPAQTAGNEARVAARRHKKHRRRVSKPLKVTPPLGQRDFIFPVVGPSGYVDTSGDARSDVHGGWHHGDDIFAPFGVPVVAVASGTINRVGWEKVGGWRLWVRNDAGDEFYYAHLSGYTRSDFHSTRVNAGQVIGFLGNTGDAFTGAPHLHFEVHPRQLLCLRYDGAVDPTKYLDSWSHLESVDAPLPVHPRLPEQLLLRREASYVFRQLLVVRHVLVTPVEQRKRPQIPALAGANGLSFAQPLPVREAASAANSRAGTAA